MSRNDLAFHNVGANGESFGTGGVVTLVVGGAAIVAGFDLASDLIGMGAGLAVSGTPQMPQVRVLLRR